MSASSPRVAPVPEGQGNPLVRYTFRATRKRVGRVVSPIGVLARHPWLMAGNGGMELCFERSSRVDTHLKELATLKAAALVGCEFCIDIGSMLATRSGITEQQLRTLHVHADSDAFDAREKLVLDLATGMTATPVHVTDELWSALRAHFEEPALVELVQMIGWENHRARTNHAFGLGSEGFSDGAVCARAELPEEGAGSSPRRTPKVAAAGGYPVS